MKLDLRLSKLDIQIGDLDLGLDKKIGIYIKRYKYPTYGPGNVLPTV